MKLKYVAISVFVIMASSLQHGMGAFGTGLSKLYNDPIAYITQQINLYVQNKSDDEINAIELCLNEIIGSKDVTEVQKAYEALVNLIIDVLIQDKSLEEVQQLCPNVEGFFKMALRFCTVKTLNKNLDELECKDFIKNIDQYVNCIKKKKPKKKQVILFTQPYLKYVLPLIPYFCEQKIQTLDLSYQGLSFLPVEIICLSTLKNLYLDHNSLLEISEKINELSHLEILNLSENQLTRLPNNIIYLCLLRELSVVGNQLTELPQFFNSLIGLKKLNISKNQIAENPKVLEQMNNQQLIVTI